MISKTLHYIWLSGDEFDAVTEQCLESWRAVMPDYEVKGWGIDDFPMSEMPAFVHKAIEKQKWAFATDYLRLWVLYNHGGIYMDADVLVKRPFDELLGARFFSSVEYYPDLYKSYLAGDPAVTKYSPEGEIPGMALQFAVLGSEPGHPFVGDCMDYYRGRRFVYKNGRAKDCLLSSGLGAYVATRYGFVYENKPQRLDSGIVLYESSTFAAGAGQATPESYAVHPCNGSWRTKSLKERLSEVAPAYVKKAYRAVKGTDADTGA